MSDLNVRLVLSAIDRMSPALAGAARQAQAFAGKMSGATGFGLVGAAASNLTAHIRGVGEAAATVGQRLTLLGTAGGLLGGGLVAALKTQVIDVSAQFERLGAVLKVTEGSSEKAQVALDWVSKFATDTPYELDQVAEAFVQLRSYGLEPTKGLLQTLGDTAAGMNKPLMSAVEAIADAVTGENERLKQFGITAAKSGSKIAYSYTDAAGKQQTKVVNANNRAMIQSTLQAIWNQKYGGAMKELSKTWDGILSNLADAASRFSLAIGKAGFFDFIKGEAQGLLTLADQMAKDGTLKAWAQNISDGLIRAFQEGKTAFLEFLDVGRSVVGGLLAVKEFFGSWKPIMASVAAVIAGPLIASVVALIPAIGALGVALLATPVGWVVGALATMGAVGYALYANWDTVTQKLVGAWAWAQGALSSIWDSIVSAIQPLIDALSGALGAVGRVLGIGGQVASAAQSAQSAVPAAAAAQRFGGDINVRFAGAPAGTQVTGVKASPGLGLGVMLGPLGVMP